jgi:hypothetical protein
MPRLSSATLQGWVIPLVGVPYGEHTYVTSSCGLVWGCWGGASGGSSLSSGLGSSIIADCLAQPNGLAGIRYGLTGVCHQIANRILHPAGISVAGTQMYMLSAMTYGRYGRFSWPELSVCYAGGTILALGAPAAAPSRRNPSSTIGVYNSPVSNTVATEGPNVAEFLALVEATLAYRVDQPTLAKLAAIQANLQHTQAEIASWLDAGEIKPEQYLELLNTLLRSAMEQSRILLGDERFYAVFGEAGKNPEGLVDRATFLEFVQSEGKAIKPGSD